MSKSSICERNARNEEEVNMKHSILVTGGAGFIGSNLCRYLIENGDDVICLDDLSSGSMNGIDPLLRYANFSFVQQDVIEQFDFDVDQIYNLACPASPVHYQRDRIKTIRTNILGVFNVLELARRRGAIVLQASTSEVYGDSLVHPQTEDYWGNVNPLGPRACYDEGKRAAEALFFDYHRQYGTEIRLIRIFNTYGPMLLENDGRVISNFIVQALKNENITIYGDGTQTRCFCYIDDLIVGMVRHMNNSRGFLGPVNLGNPHEISVLDLANRVVAMTGSRSVITYNKCPIDDPHRRKPVISLAQKELDWSPHVSMEEGLEKTIAYFRERLEGQQ